MLVWLARLLMRTLLATYRVDVRGRGVIARLREQKRPIIYAFWHGEQFVLIPFHRGQSIGLMVSLSRDGAAQARVLGGFGFVPYRGSSSHRGAAALVGLIRHVREGGDAGMAVDGPKGPLHEVKPGVLTLAYKSGGAIVPLRVHAARCWRLRKTWDAYFIPRPFARVTLGYGAPVELTGDMAADLRTLSARLEEPVENWPA
jgi:hypothetical protein